MTPPSPDPRLNEAYSLMAAALMAKMDQAERRSDARPPPRGVPWERYAMGLLSLLFSLLSVLFWDAKHDLEDLRRTLDRQSGTLAYMESVRSVLEERNVRLTLQEQKLLVLDAQFQARVSSLTQRLIALTSRLDLLTAPPGTPRARGEDWDDAPGR